MTSFTDAFKDSARDANRRLHAEAWERRKLGLELRQKYEMYFVALAFTLAGLAVQSARPVSAAWLAVAEIAGWTTLAAAGCVGLWRVSQMWLVLVGVAEHADPEASKEEIEALEVQLGRLEHRVRAWSRPQFATFLVGLILLMVTRGSSLLAIN